MQEESNTSWVLEKGDSPPVAPLYFGPHRVTGRSQYLRWWTSNLEEAVRFSRHEDAERLFFSLRRLEIFNGILRRDDRIVETAFPSAVDDNIRRNIPATSVSARLETGENGSEK